LRSGRSSLAAAFGLVAILVDTTVVFPADINVRVPESLVFSSAIDFAAMILSRLAYYVVWHIAWRQAHLRLLCGTSGVGVLAFSRHLSRSFTARDTVVHRARIDFATRLAPIPGTMTIERRSIVVIRKAASERRRFR
jgi:hypothetical protein